MKEILKMKTTIIAIVPLLLSIVCVVASSASVPSDKLVSKMGKSIQDKNVQKYMSCFSLEDQDDAEMEFNLFFMEEAYENLGALFGGEDESSQKIRSSEYKRVLLQGKEIKNEDDTITIPVKLLVLSDGEIVDSSTFNVTVYEQEGVKYLR